MTRFRYPPAAAVMAMLALLGSAPFLIEAVNAMARLSSAEPLQIAKSLLIVVPLILLTLVVWAWQAGTDANEYGIRVRALLGRRIIPWTEVEALTTDGQGRVVAVLTSGQVFRLTAVKPADLPRLLAARGAPATADATDPAPA